MPIKKDEKTELTKLANEMAVFGSLEDYTEKQIFSVLAFVDDLYYNGEESPLSDEDYDEIYRYASLSYRDNEYFLTIGSAVRTGKEKLPVTMGSLDQVYENEIGKYVRDNSLEHEMFVLTEKLDGYSCLLCYNDGGQLVQSFSRGNGTEGAQTSRHTKRIPSIPQHNHELSGYLIRGEVLFDKNDFVQKVQGTFKNRAGKPYRNPRNAISGLMNAESNDINVYKHIRFVAYEIVNAKDISKLKQLQTLQRCGFETPHHMTTPQGMDLNDRLMTKYLDERRKNCKYEIDGVVIDVNDAKVRQKLIHTRDTINPKYAVKFKVGTMTAVSTVVDIELNVSKHGYIKPTIIVAPVELDGVTVKRCTGWNMKYIYDNKIQIGSRVRMERKGMVVPNCIEVIDSGPLK